MSTPNHETANPPAHQMGYDNDLMYPECHDMFMKQTSDVQFIYESENDVIKVPANKSVLATLSPVFSAIFNGDPKQIGEM